MAVRRPLIIDGGSIKELPSGDSLPAVAKTAATLTHTAGAISLDVQAANVFRFEADEYASGATPSYVGGGGHHADSGTVSVNMSGWGLQDGDLLLAHYADIGTAGGKSLSGFTPLVSPVGYSRVFWARWETGDATTISLDQGGTLDGTLVVGAFRGVDGDSPFDVPYSQTASAADLPTITTVTDEALIVGVGMDLWNGNNVNLSAPSGFAVSGSAGILSATAQVGNIMVHNTALTDPAGTVNPAHFNPSGAGTNIGKAAVTMALRPQAAFGENNYTITFSNIPVSGMAVGVIDIELKTDTGSVAFAGGTISWRGAVPSFDEIGKYLIAFWADSTGVMLLDLTAAVTAGGAMSGAAIVSAIDSQLGGSTWQGGAGGSVAQYIHAREIGTTTLTTSGVVVDFDTDSYSSSDFSLAGGVITYTGAATVSALINANVGCGAPDTTRSVVNIAIQTRPSGGSWTTVAQGKGYTRQAADGGGAACSAIVELDEDDEIRVLGITESGTISTEASRSGITINTI